VRDRGLTSLLRFDAVPEGSRSSSCTIQSFFGFCRQRRTLQSVAERTHRS
jgi:hypothetical protein